MSQSSLIRVLVLWDIENTSAPGGTSIAQAAANITQALQKHLGNPSIAFCGYGDADEFSSKQIEGCEAAAIEFKDVASKMSEAADKIIILDMFQFALDVPPPSFILLISHDQDFERAVKTLRSLSYTVLVALEDRVSLDVVNTFQKSCDVVCSWDSLATGCGFRLRSSLDPIPISLRPAVKTQSPYQMSTSFVTGIFWDLETCPCPKGILPEKVAGYITNSLLSHPLIKTERSFVPFNAYDDSKNLTHHVIDKWRKSGITFVNTPMGVKGDLLDKKILVEVLRFAFENPVPCNIMVITGNSSLCPALCALRNRGFTVILAIPTGEDIPSLNNAGSFLFEWPHQDEEINDDSMWVKPGGLRGLKRNIVYLLTNHHGHIKLDVLANEYHKLFGRQLVPREFNCENIDTLLRDLVEDVEIQGVGEKRTVQLKFQLTSLDVKTNDLEKFLEGFCIGIPLSIFEVVYQHQKYKTSLEKYYRRFGVKDVEGLCKKIPNVAMLIEDKKTSTKRVMYAPVVKDRRKRLELDVIKLLEEYTGQMLFDYFECCYKEMFKGAIMYDYCGLTDLEDLCEVFKDILEVRVQEVTFSTGRVKVKEIHLLKPLPHLQRYSGGGNINA